MTLTRKHFKAIADAVATSNTMAGVAVALAEWLRTENPRFDEARFLEACRKARPAPR